MGKILYLRIKNVSANGQITDYAVKNVFKNETEMAKWFAYDINREYKPAWYIGDTTPLSFDTRYNKLVRTQNLTGLDTDMLGYIRDHVLYDMTYHKFIDIRNFAQAIRHQTNASILHTEWEMTSTRRIRQGRKHHKSWKFHGGTAGKKHYLIRYDKYYPIVEDDIEYKLPNISCGKKSNVMYGHSGCVENNWKTKKVRHQWMRHTDTSCKTHYSVRDKGCGSDWTELDDSLVVDEAA